MKYLLHQLNFRNLCTCSGRADLETVLGCPARGHALLLRSVPALWLGSPEKPNRKPSARVCPREPTAARTAQLAVRDCSAVKRPPQGRWLPGRGEIRTRSPVPPTERGSQDWAESTKQPRAASEKGPAAGGLGKNAGVQRRQTSSELTPHLPPTAPSRPGLLGLSRAMYHPLARLHLGAVVSPTAQVSKL